uniref:NADH:ubiquinone reductase (H(+)-translocating) n=1 Tax=Neomazocraes dorosomatis TaxID=1131909 RepID=A0A3G0WYS3_9PLAT|nr:NADH dehydrogenase subunit 5 [Neomazocraes dorosomatis]
MLSVCGYLSINYVFHYLGVNNVSSNYLWLNIFSFLATMIMLCLTGNLISGLIFWEYLGVVSFFLILYYQNYFGLRAAAVTLITSRIGDIFFFLLVGFYIYNQFFFSLSGFIFCLSCFFIIGSKSAFYPLISWLLETMRAPTPVSALVHSSTLVAAGVWFVSEYNWLLNSNNTLNLLVCCSLLTVISTFICSLIINDVKKIVALSTSNNISWCLLYSLSGDFILCLVQLLSHGLGKCLFFTLIGDIMSSNESGQNFKNYSRRSNVWYNGGTLVSSFMLSGSPFLGIYFSKHFFLLNGFMDSLNVFFMLLILIGILGTNAYSVRLFFLTIGVLNSNVVFYGNIYVINIFYTVLMLFCNYCFVFSGSESSLIGLWQSLFVYFLVFFGWFIGWVFYSNYFLSFYNLKVFGSNVGNLDLLVNINLFIHSFYMNLVNLFLYRWDFSFIVGVFKLMNLNFLILGFSCLVLFSLFCI